MDSPCLPPLRHGRRNRHRIPLAFRPYDTGEGTDTGFPLPSALEGRRNRHRIPLPSAPTTRAKEQNRIPLACPRTGEGTDTGFPCLPPLRHGRRNRHRIPLAFRPYDTGEGTDAGFPLPSAPTTRAKEQTQDSPCPPPLRHGRRNRHRIPLALRPYDTGEGTDAGFPLPSAPTTRAKEQTQDSPCHPPLRHVTAFVCGCISLLLLIIALASTSWLEANQYRQGLWQECNWTDVKPTSCSNNPTKAWIQTCGAFCVIAFLVALTGTVLNGVGLATRNPDRKFTFYRIAMCLHFGAIACIVIAVIVFPAMFMQEINQRGKPAWYFGWAYGVAWGAAIFILGAAVLLLLDRESEEIYYKEKTRSGSDSNA
ncbi:hypothetical protein LSAT2_012086 [Lamellibrachia satsuma]|nr:hypothetical protein LSAT2_012086 [Lamellibrachia satsuma]